MCVAAFVASPLVTADTAQPRTEYAHDTAKLLSSHTLTVCVWKVYVWYMCVCMYPVCLSLYVVCIVCVCLVAI
jgi:hypothetical protein